MSAADADSAEASRLRNRHHWFRADGSSHYTWAQEGLNGYEVTLFERDPGFDAKSREWSMFIHWGIPALSKLLPEEVLEDLPKGMCNPYLDHNEETETVPVYNGITGEVLFKVYTPGVRRVLRQRLRKVFAKGLDIQWGKKLEGLFGGGESDPVRLTFHDGSTHEADLVLGADGSQSKVREILLGPEAAKSLPSGYTVATAAVNYGDAKKVEFIQNFHPVTSVTLHPDCTGGCGILEAKNPDDLSTWSTFWFKVWRGSVSMQGQEALDFIKANTKGQCEPFNSAVASTPDGSSCHVDEMRYWIPQGWDNRSGRVSLAGDLPNPTRRSLSGNYRILTRSMRPSSMEERLEECPELGHLYDSQCLPCNLSQMDDPTQASLPRSYY